MRTVATQSAGRSSIVPLMRYSDVSKAIEWLCASFGFEQHTTAQDSDGSVYYALLTYRHGMIMVGSEINSELDKILSDPEDAGASQTCYLVVDDINAHYARVCEAGAEIVLELKSNGAQGYGYSCRDPQGHIWNFGTYDPWHGSVAPAVQADVEPRAKPAWRDRVAVGTVSALALLTIGVSAAWWSGGLSGPELHAPLASVLTPGTDAQQEHSSSVTVAQSKTDRADYHELKNLRTALAQERSAHIAARESLEKLTLASKSEKSRLENQLRVFKQDAEVGSERLSALQRELVSASTKVQRSQDKVLQLEDQLEHARTSSVGLAGASDELIEQLRSERAEKVALKKKLERSAKNLAGLKENMAKLERQIAAANAPSSPQGEPGATAPAVAAWNSTGDPTAQSDTEANKADADSAENKTKKPKASKPKRKRKYRAKKKKKKYSTTKKKKKLKKNSVVSPIGTILQSY